MARTSRSKPTTTASSPAPPWQQVPMPTEVEDTQAAAFVATVDVTAGATPAPPVDPLLTITFEKEAGKSNEALPALLPNLPVDPSNLDGACAGPRASGDGGVIAASSAGLGVENDPIAGLSALAFAVDINDAALAAMSDPADQSLVLSDVEPLADTSSHSQDKVPEIQHRPLKPDQHKFSESCTFSLGEVPNQGKRSSYVQRARELAVAAVSKLGDDSVRSSVNDDAIHPPPLMDHEGKVEVPSEQDGDEYADMPAPPIQDEGTVCQQTLKKNGAHIQSPLPRIPIRKGVEVIPHLPPGASIVPPAPKPKSTGIEFSHVLASPVGFLHPPAPKPMNKGVMIHPVGIVGSPMSVKEAIGAKAKPTSKLSASKVRKENAEKKKTMSQPKAPVPKPKPKAKPKATIPKPKTKSPVRKKRLPLTKRGKVPPKPSSPATGLKSPPELLPGVAMNPKSATETVPAKAKVGQVQRTVASSSPAMKIGVPSTSQRSPQGVVTTARKTTKATGKQNKTRTGTNEPRRPNIGLAVRVRVKVKFIRLRIKPGHPGYGVIADKSDDMFIHANVMQATGRKLYILKMDGLPKGHEMVEMHRDHILVLYKGEEEKAFSHDQENVEALIERLSKINDSDLEDAEEGNPDNVEAPSEKQKKGTPAQESVDAFVNMDKADQLAAKTFFYKYGPKDEEGVVWTILGEDEEIVGDAMPPVPENHNPLKIDIPWHPDRNKVDYNAIYFKYFFPDLTGLAEKMDNFLQDPRCTIHSTVKHDKIKFHQPDADDPDYLVSIYPDLTMLLSSINTCISPNTSSNFASHVSLQQRRR